MEAEALPSMAANPGQYVGHRAPVRRRLTEAEEIMYCYKVKECSQRTQHNWAACPCMHPEENARRRDPRKYRYLSEPCPDWKAIGVCLLGNTCPFSHGLFEINLHPTKFRTQLCSEFPRCNRVVCFFAHGQRALRQPDYSNTYENGKEAAKVREVLMVKALISQKMQESPQLRHIAPDEVADNAPRISMKVRRELGMDGNKGSNRARQQGANGNGFAQMNSNGVAQTNGNGHVSASGFVHANGNGLAQGVAPMAQGVAPMARHEHAAWVAAQQPPDDALALAQYLIATGQCGHGSPTNGCAFIIGASQGLAASMSTYPQLPALSQGPAISNAQVLAANAQSIAAALAMEAVTQGIAYSQARAMSPALAAHVAPMSSSAYPLSLPSLVPTSYGSPLLPGAGQVMQAGPSYVMNTAGPSQAATMLHSAGPSYAVDMQRPRVDTPMGSPGYSQEALAHARLYQATRMEGSDMSTGATMREMLKRGYRLPTSANHSEDEDNSGKSTPESHPAGHHRHFDVAAATETLAQNVLGRAGTLSQSQYQALASATGLGSDFSLFS